MTTHIVSALALNLRAGDRQSIATEHAGNLEAYDCFLRGRELAQRGAREANRNAQPLLRRAIELDPRFAPPYARLACALMVDYASGWSASPAQALEEAEKAARLCASRPSASRRRSSTASSGQGSPSTSPTAPAIPRATA